MGYKEPKKIGNKWARVYLSWEKPKFRLFAGEDYEGEWEKHMRLSFTATFLIGLVGIFITGISWWSLIWLPLFIWGYGNVYITLPIKWVKMNKENEGYDWGFYLYGGDQKWYQMFETLWICKGADVKCIHMPWELTWVRTSSLRKDNTWEHETYRTGRNKSFWDKDKWGGILFSETHPYHYNLSNGTVQEVLATIRVEEREWRWRACKWLPLTKKVNKTIEIDFSSEVGERSGSYKGGTLGCSYTLKKGEEPWECLARMERERKF